MPYDSHTEVELSTLTHSRNFELNLMLQLMENQAHS